MSWHEILAYPFLIAGTLFLLVGAFGILKFPDVYCRGHALGKALTMGVSLLLIGLWFDLGVDKAGIKIPLAILFQGITIPLGSHLLCLYAYQKGIPSGKSKPKPREMS